METSIATAKAKKEYDHQVEIINSGIETINRECCFIGAALAKIRDEKLYLADGFKTFESCCEKVFGFDRSTAYRKISAGQAAGEMLKIDKKTPFHESHATAISSCADNPADQRKLWSKVLETGKKPTAKLIKSVAEDIKLLSPAPVRYEEIRKEPEKTNSNVIFVDAVQKEETVEVNSEQSDQPEEPVYTGVPSADDRFDPRQFDSAVGSDGIEIDSGTPKHLIAIANDAKEFRAIGIAITQLKNRCLALAAKPAGSWMHTQDIERIFEMARLEIKTTAYECCCPVCKNNPDRRCIKCEGRGFLDYTHHGLLTEAEKKWVQNLQKKS